MYSSRFSSNRSNSNMVRMQVVTARNAPTPETPLIVPHTNRALGELGQTRSSNCNKLQYRYLLGSPTIEVWVKELHRTYRRVLELNNQEVR